MLIRVFLGHLVVALGLLLPYPVCEATTLGAVVNVVPLEKSGGNMVRLHIVNYQCCQLLTLCIRNFRIDLKYALR